MKSAGLLAGRRVYGSQIIGNKFPDGCFKQEIYFHLSKIWIEIEFNYVIYINAEKRQKGHLQAFLSHFEKFFFFPLTVEKQFQMMCRIYSRPMDRHSRYRTLVRSGNGD